MRTLALITLASLAWLTLPQTSLVANNVNAFVSGGNLYIYGDGNANSIEITADGPNSVAVSGFTSSDGMPTVVNGTPNGTASLSDWTSGVYVFLYGGDDVVEIRDLTVQGHAHIDVSTGDDGVYIGESSLIATALQSINDEGGTMFLSGLVVLGASGEDEISLINTDVEGHTTIDAGTQDDWVRLGGDDVFEEMMGFDSHFGRTLVVIPGTGFDEVEMTSLDVALNTVVDDVTDSLDLSMTDVETGANLFVFGTPDSDDLDLENVQAGNLLEIYAEGGDDDLELEVAAKRLNVFAGIGNDVVNMQNSFAGVSRVYLGSGDDMVNVFDVEIDRLWLYGEAGDDSAEVAMSMGNILAFYGGGGIDSLMLMANNYDSVQTASVENQ